MADVKKYVDTLALEEQIRQAKAADAKVLEEAKSHAESLGVNYDTAGAGATAKAEAIADADGKLAVVNEELAKKANQTALQAEIDRATGKENEIVASVGAVDEKADKNAEDIAAINDEATGILAKAKADATEKANAVQAEVDALEEYVGTIPESATSKDIVGYIQEKTAGIATSENLEELTNRVAQAETDIDNIEKDYLVEADKTELTGKIDTAQAAADAAQEHSEGVASDLAEAVEALEGADAAQVERIAAIEGTIVGLSGAMHFEGVKDALPEDVSGYESGDVIIIGNKEYVFNGTAFVEFGDASVNAEAITALTSRVDTAEEEIDTLQEEMDAVESAVATKAEQSALDAEVTARTEADAGLDTRIKALEDKTGTGEGSVTEQIATAKQEAITAAAEDAATKDEQVLVDAKAYADAEDAKIESRVDALETDTHTHANKALLDTYTQTEADLADAVAKKHEHANATVIDGITAEKVAAWDAAEQNAKDYADGLDDATNAKVDGIGERVAAVEGSVATKAESSVVTSIDERLTIAEAGVAANKSAIEAFVAITPEEISAMWA